MRLLRLDGGEQGPTLDLHPFFTVVRGLSGARREQVLSALRALPAGQDPGLRGLLEAHGVLLDLDRDTLDLLDLRATDLDVVVRHADLPLPGNAAPPPEPVAPATPAPTVAPGELDEARRRAEDANETYAGLRDALDRLHDERQRASDDVAKASSALEAARSELDPFAAGAVDQAVQDLTTLERELAVRDGLQPAEGATPTSGAGPGGAAGAAGGDAAVDVDRLEGRRVELARALEALAGIDVGPVVDALAALRSAEGVELVPHPDAIAMADALAAGQAALEQFDAQLEAQGLGPMSVRRKIDNLRLQVARLDQEARPKIASAEDTAALEEAHDAVVEAEERAKGRLAGRGAQRKLEEAKAVEQEVLDRMGFASYTSYSMSAAAPEVNVEAKVALQQARTELAAAEAEVEAVSQMVEADPRRRELVAHLHALRQQALPFVGGNDRGDLEAALRAVRVRPPAPIDQRTPEEAAQVLRAALEHHGVAFGDRAMQPSDVAQVAAVWLAEMEDSTRANRARLEQEMASIDAALGAARSQQAQAPPAAAAPAPPAALADDPRLDDARAAVATAEARLARHRAVVARVASLHAELEAATEKERELLEQVQAQSTVLDQAAETARTTAAAHQAVEARARTVAEAPAPAPASTPAAATGDIDDDQLEWYLLGRLSAQRHVSYAGSVPLVFDEALLGLPGEEVRHLLERLERASESVQVIFLSDDRDVLDWVASAGLERAAAVSAA